MNRPPWETPWRTSDVRDGVAPGRRSKARDRQRDRRTRRCGLPALAAERAACVLPESARVGLPRLSPLVCLMPFAVAIAVLCLAASILVSTAVCLVSGMVGGPAFVLTTYLLIEQKWLKSGSSPSWKSRVTRCWTWRVEPWGPSSCFSLQRA